MRLAVTLFAALAFLAAASSAPAHSNPDPAALKEAQSLMNRFDVGALAKQQVARLSQQFDQMLQSIDLGEDKNQLLTEMAQRFQKQLEGRLPRYFEDTTLIYARVFTLD